MFGVFAAGASADTQKINNVQYGVVVEQAQEIKMENGVTVMAGGLSHATVIDANGDVSSQWCRQSAVLGDDGNPVAGGGFCTIISQNGDLLWVWFGGGKWGAIGGTGGWAGASGGGTTEAVSQNPDGRSFVNKAMGDITTP
jgi:hypothetical protein